MKKFEYKKDKMVCEFAEVSDIPVDDADYFKRMGEDGWELVTVVKLLQSYPVYYWKREKVADAYLESGINLAPMFKEAARMKNV